jgi:hypothetical protein
MKYSKFMYLYPPRPVQTIHPSELNKYDDGTFIAQPKYNGTCCLVFISETDLIVMNRHRGTIFSDYKNIDFRGMYRGKGWMVVCGEFLNKNKKGEDGNPFNLKFIIWDILVYNGEYLIGSTFGDRIKLIEDLYPCSKMRVSGSKLEHFEHLCMTNHKNIFIAPTYNRNFQVLYNSIVDTDLYEGLVLKRADAKLTYGLSEKNNNGWQIKCRKPTKSYKF